jgi:hypothetical protein
MREKNRALRELSHGIGLQVFMGIGFMFASWSGQRLPEFMADPGVFGGVLIALAINSLCYVSRYKKALSEEG